MTAFHSASVNFLVNSFCGSSPSFLTCSVTMLDSVGFGSGADIVDVQTQAHTDTPEEVDAERKIGARTYEQRDKHGRTTHAARG